MSYRCDFCGVERGTRCGLRTYTRSLTETELVLGFRCRSRRACQRRVDERAKVILGDLVVYETEPKEHRGLP